MEQKSQAISASAPLPLREIIRHSLKHYDDKGLDSLKQKLLDSARLRFPVPKEFFHFKPLGLPANIEEKTFQDPVHDVPVYYYVARAPIERGVVVAITGLKEEISLSPERIKELNDQGLSYICLRLPNADKQNGIMPLYERYIKFWLLDPESPVHQMFPHLRKVIEAHSTGALIAMMLATHEDTREEIAENYDALYADAPFTDNPNASELDNAVSREVFTQYATIHHNDLVEQTILGNYYMIDGDVEEGKLIVPEEALNEFTYKVGLTAQKMMTLWTGGKPWEQDANGLDGGLRLPTYGQILEIRSWGRAHRHYLEENGYIAHLPITIFAHERDRFSSYKATAHWATLLGADLVSSKGFHNPLNKDDKAFATLQDSVEQYLPLWPAPNLTIEKNMSGWVSPLVSASNVTLPQEYLTAAITPAPLPAPVKTGNGWHIMPPIRDFVRFSKESPARIFNSAASLIQRTFGHGDLSRDMSKANGRLIALMADGDSVTTLSVPAVANEAVIAAHTPPWSSVHASFASYTAMPEDMVIKPRVYLAYKNKQPAVHAQPVAA